jgi:hypothetical protein
MGYNKELASLEVLNDIRSLHNETLDLLFQTGSLSDKQRDRLLYCWSFYNETGKEHFRAWCRDNDRTLPDYCN